MLPLDRPFTGREEVDSVAEVLGSHWLTQGPKLEAFERAFAAYTGAAHAVALGNCTVALQLTLTASGIGHGAEVICPSLTYIATCNAIFHAGAVPVFADVDPERWTLDPADVERRITPDTRAVMVVHQMGMPADVDALRTLCTQKHLLLIEDAACAAGSLYRGRPIGGGGNPACFSFHPRKVITAGEGGMVTTDDAGLATQLRLLRHHGMSVSDRVRFEVDAAVFDEHVIRGFNARMSDVHAAIGCVQMERLETILTERRPIAALYHSAFSHCRGILPQYEPQDCASNYQSYAFLTTKACPLSRDELVRKLRDAGIGARRGILTAHREPAYADVRRVSLPVSEDVSDRMVLLPLFVGMTEKDIALVIDTVLSLAGATVAV